MEKICASLDIFLWPKEVDWIRQDGSSVITQRGNKGVLPVRSSLPSWKTLISAKSANYFECVPDRVRIKIRPDRFWPGGPQERFRMPRLIGPLASRRWIRYKGGDTREKQTEPEATASHRINATSFLSRVRIWLRGRI